MKLQVNRCATRHSKGPPPCFVCKGHSEGRGENCRFKDFRCLSGTECPSQEVASAPQSTPPTTFNADPNIAEIRELQASLAPFVREMLLEMLAHEALPDLIRRRPDLKYRLTCDYCFTTILSCSFFCLECGYEICRHCRAEHGTKLGYVCSHAPSLDGAHVFRPLSRMAAGRVSLVLQEVESISAMHSIPPPPVVNATAKCRLNAEHFRDVPEVRPGQDELFRSLWHLDIPIIIRGLHRRMQGSWSPESFVRTHGKESVMMLKSGGLPPQKVSVARFFEEFARSDADRGHAVKVKDWPPSTSFQTDFPQNYQAFMQAVPMPSYTCSNGFRNLIAHYGVPPARTPSLRPDVGPKVYIATPDLPREGSTRLHLDVTCAINILSWTSSGDPETTGAEWYIFDPRDLDELRKYLRSKRCPDFKPNAGEIEDPVHAQQTYLNKEMLDDLAARRVHPYKIEQRLGDAVFIPAGAAHQVSNVQACIKVACDFLSIEGIRESSKVMQDFRRERMRDVLPLEVVLWDAWTSLTFQAAEAAKRSDGPALTRHEKKNKYQRDTPRGQEDDARRKKRRKIQTSKGRLPPVRDYGCPFKHCARSRRFAELGGVFNHLNDVHKLRVPKHDRDQFEDLDDDEFQALFEELPCNFPPQASSTPAV